MPFLQGAHTAIVPYTADIPDSLSLLREDEGESRISGQNKERDERALRRKILYGMRERGEISMGRRILEHIAAGEEKEYLPEEGGASDVDEDEEYLPEEGDVADADEEEYLLEEGDAADADEEDEYSFEEGDLRERWRRRLA